MCACGICTSHENGSAHVNSSVEKLTNVSSGAGGNGGPVVAWMDGAV